MWPETVRPILGGCPRWARGIGSNFLPTSEFDVVRASLKSRGSVKYRYENWLDGCRELGSLSIASGFQGAYCRSVSRYALFSVPISRSGPLPLVQPRVHGTVDGRIDPEVLLD